jgi:hypothetical protein
LPAGKKYVAEYVNDCASCGSFLDLGDDDVEPPPSQQLRGAIAAGTLRHHLASQQQPSQLPVLQLSQPSKVRGFKVTPALRLQQQLRKYQHDAAPMCALHCAQQFCITCLASCTTNHWIHENMMAA